MVSRQKAVCGGLILLATAAGCKRSTANQQESHLPGGPVAVFAVDGMEWEVVASLLASDDLPTLAELMTRGTFGRLATFKPAVSPPIWTSVATGKTPHQHGIRGFLKPAPEDAHQRLYNACDRRTKALWNILTDHGLASCTVGWWMTFPAEPVNGIMVTQTNTSSRSRVQRGVQPWKGTLVKGITGQVYPPERQAEMLGFLDRTEAGLADLTREIFGDFPQPMPALPRRLWDNTLWCFRADATYLAIAGHLLRDDSPFALTCVYLGGTDTVGHRFWRYRTPQQYAVPPPPDDVAVFGKVIDDYYRFVDRSLGKLLKQLDPRTNVLVISDHGMRAVNLNGSFDPSLPTRELNSGHHDDSAPPGVFIAAGPQIRRSGGAVDPRRVTPQALPVVGSVLDITPTLLALLGLPVGRDMDGHVLTRVIDDAFLRAHPVRFIESHDSAEWLATRGCDTPERAEDIERLEQLRDLGYIDGS